MKKLMMFVAAMTIVGGAYASTCNECDDCGCSLVYDFKASLKTGAAKGSNDSCNPTCYRTCSKLNLVGYFLNCEACDCEAFKAMTFTAINKKTKGYYFDTVAPEWTLLNQMGKKNTEVEAYWTATGELTGGGCEETPDGRTITIIAAGCGKIKKSTDCGVNGVIDSISGSVVGFGTGPSCAADCSACGEVSEDTISMVYPLCDEVEAEADTVYYGTWSMKYNAKKSKKGCNSCDGKPNYNY